MGVFNQRFEALFPCPGALGCVVCFAPLCWPSLTVHKCGAAGCYPLLSLPCSPPLWVRPSRFIWANVGPQGLPSGQTACPVGPTLRQSQFCHSKASPLRLGCCLRPSYRSGWMFMFCLLGVGLPCRLIICQFWSCEEMQCVYLRRHLGSPFDCNLDNLSIHFGRTAHVKSILIFLIHKHSMSIYLGLLWYILLVFGSFQHPNFVHMMFYIILFTPKYPCGAIINGTVLLILVYNLSICNCQIM